VRDIAYQIPMHVIADIIGIPEDDRAWVFEHTDGLLKSGDPYGDYTETITDQSGPFIGYLHIKDVLPAYSKPSRVCSGRTSTKPCAWPLSVGCHSAATAGQRSASELPRFG